MIPSYEQQLIKFESIPNARQLGGYVNIKGKEIKNNMLIRSGSLFNATESDIAKLSQEISVKAIYDLRSEMEISKKMDKAVHGAENIHLDLLYTINNQAIKKVFMEKEENPKENPVIKMCRNPLVIDYITNLYSRLITNQNAQNLFHRMFQSILATKGAPVLWHCTYGKDRTGIAALLILSVLEVDLATIKEDFLKTNIAYEKEISTLVQLAKSENFTEQQIWAVKSMAGVAEESFDTTIEIINQKYNGINNYLQNQINLTQQEIELFRKYYLK